LDPARLSRATLALLIGAVLIGGAMLGSVVTSAISRGQPSPSVIPTVSVAPSAAALPRTDVDGDDFERLPRYPGSVRTEFAVSTDDGFRLTAVEYLADADLADVRRFYQDVIAEQEWQRADIDYAAGEWTYLIVDGGTEALVEIEVSGGFVEIDLQVSSPVASPTPRPAPQTTPTPVSTPQPPAPPPPGDDDGDDDDDSDDDGDD
jgi:hypothetical protein